MVELNYGLITLLLQNAHHIKTRSSIVKKFNIKTIKQALKCSELWDINNGITLCKKCHSKTFKKEETYEKYFYQLLKKNNKDDTIKGNKIK